MLGQGGRFLEAFRPFQRKVAYFGAINGLAQSLLKIAAPGVPDFYQGSELWNFSLVDPDNRRPVDYQKRMRPARFAAPAANPRAAAALVGGTRPRTGTDAAKL